jgi:DNA-binding transcriptional ArsR family regulator
MPADQGVLRLRFTAADLLKTRVLPKPDPMWELVLSLRALVPDGRLDQHTTWRREVRQRQRADERLTRVGALLRVLVPPTGNYPDFLTPQQLGAEIATGLEAVRGTPMYRLRSDLNPARLRRADTPLCRLLVQGDREAMRDLVTALRGYHDRVVAPHWPEVVRQVTADRDDRLNQTCDAGLDAMLGRLGPTIHWQWPCLTANYPVNHTIELGGRGLTLIPSYFCNRVVTLIDPELTPVLVYPARRLAVDPLEIDLALGRLTPLIGGTRARIMISLRAARSTSELAEAIGMSLASASQQVTVLRDAGLATSKRDGRAVRHALTQQGRSLLEGR